MNKITKEEYKELVNKAKTTWILGGISIVLSIIFLITLFPVSATLKTIGFYCGVVGWMGCIFSLFIGIEAITLRNYYRNNNKL